MGNAPQQAASPGSSGPLYDFVHNNPQMQNMLSRALQQYQPQPQQQLSAGGSAYPPAPTPPGGGQTAGYPQAVLPGLMDAQPQQQQSPSYPFLNGGWSTY